MPSVLYGSSFFKSGLLIILQAGVTKVKSGVKHSITFELPKIAQLSCSVPSQKNRILQRIEMLVDTGLR